MILPQNTVLQQMGQGLKALAGFGAKPQGLNLFYFPAKRSISSAAPSSVTKIPLEILWLTAIRLSAFRLPPAITMTHSAF